MINIDGITEYNAKNTIEINAHGTGCSVIDFNMGASKNFFEVISKLGISTTTL